MTNEAESHLTLNPSSNASPAGGLKEINESTWVYHCMCSHGATLYVGIAANVARRLSQHRASKDWWPEVDIVIADQYVSRGQALEVESFYIKNGNRTHMKNRSGYGKDPNAPHRWVMRQYWDVTPAGAFIPGEPFGNRWRSA